MILSKIKNIASLSAFLVFAILQSGNTSLAKEVATKNHSSHQKAGKKKHNHNHHASSGMANHQSGRRQMTNNPGGQNANVARKADKTDKSEVHADDKKSHDDHGDVSKNK